MTFADWLSESRNRLRYDGLYTGSYASAQELWAGALGKVGQVWNYGESIHDREWDVLLVFDACRVDMMAALAATGEYDVLDGFDPDRDATYSVASRSPEWIAKTFDPDEYGDEIADIAYVSANPHTRDIPDKNALAFVDELWKYGWDDDLGVVPPRTVTDRGIATLRDRDPDKLVLHYMQPHLPFRSLIDDHPEWFQFDVGLDTDTEGQFKTLWRRLRDGEVDHETVWEAYLDNLVWAMEELPILRENVDAERMVITADHANAMGEWWIYGHTTRTPVPRVLKRVPWVVTDGTDRGTYEPTVEARDVHLDASDREQRLRDLGYV